MSGLAVFAAGYLVGWFITGAIVRALKRRPWRRWEVWALFDEPAFIYRCWTNSGAQGLALRLRVVRPWLAFEVRRVPR